MCQDGDSALRVGRKRMPRVPSPKRSKISRVEKIGRRNTQESRGERVIEESRRGKGMEKRGEIPERSGSLSRGRPHHHC